MADKLTFKDTFMKYRFLLKELTIKNVKLQYRNSVLGMFWSFLQPLLTMIVISFVYGNFFGRDSSAVVNYPVYLLCGKLLHSFFSSSTKKAMKSVRSHASIIKKVAVPKYIYPLSSVLSEFIGFLISLIVLVCVVVFYNVINVNPITITWRIIYAVVPIIVLFFFSLGTGMLLATLNVFFKDIANIYDVVTLLLFYVTPIVYTFDRFDFGAAGWQIKLLKLNPLYGFVEMFRGAVIHSGDFLGYFDMRNFYYCCLVTIVVMILGFTAFNKNQDKFILHI